MPRPPGSDFGTIPALTFGRAARKDEITPAERATLRAEVRRHYDDYIKDGGVVHQGDELKAATRKYKPCNLWREILQ